MNERPVASAIEHVPHFMALLDAATQILAEKVDISRVLVQLPDFAPPEALPYLAQQYDVLGYKGYLFCTTDEQRRNLLKAAIGLHRKKGTPYAIEEAIKSLGFPNALVSEGTGIKYNGEYKHNGARKYGGVNWWNFNVEVFYTGAAPDAAQINLIRKLIDVYKNTRSVLLDLRFTEIV